MKNRLRHLTVRKIGRESGVTIAMVALCIVVLFIFAALAVDMGILYTARTATQHAADAAALAGAYTFVGLSQAAQPATAEAAARSTVSKANVLGKAIDGASVTVAVDTTNRQVTVTVPRVGANAVETFFAHIMGINSVAVAATATAQASKSATGTTCLRPLYMPITAGYTVDKNTGYCTGLPMFANLELTAYGQSLIGDEMRLWSDIVPGQWGLLDIAGNGGSGIRTTLSQCSSDYGLQAACNTAIPVDTKTGRNVGPVTQGVQTLIDATNAGKCPATGADWIETVDDLSRPDPDNPGTYFKKAVFSNGVPQIHDGQTGNLITSSPNIVTVAVWDCLHETVDPGKQSVTVKGFASVFIQCVTKSGSNNYIQGFMLGAGSCGPGDTTGTGPQAIPVRLVQPPGTTGGD